MLEEHAGLYQCVARSRVGMAHAEIYLDVREPGETRAHAWSESHVYSAVTWNESRFPNAELWGVRRRRVGHVRKACHVVRTRLRARAKRQGSKFGFREPAALCEMLYSAACIFPPID